MISKDRALIFGRDATGYDVARPNYPEEAIEWILDRAGPSTAVEVGAGTGKATEGIARPGLTVTCVEPSREMASVLAAKRLPGVEVVVSGFESWEGPALPVDLIYAAQSWHWVDPADGYRHAMGMLRPGGTIALMWNVPQDRYAGLEEVYERHAPEVLAERDSRIRRRDSLRWQRELAEAGFADVSTFEHPWSRMLTPGEARALFSTYSDHMTLPRAQRERVLDAIEEEVSRLESLEVEYRTRVFAGERPEA